jgi:hypothetical protein
VTRPKGPGQGPGCRTKRPTTSRFPARVTNPSAWITSALDKLAPAVSGPLPVGLGCTVSPAFEITVCVRHRNKARPLELTPSPFISESGFNCKAPPYVAKGMRRQRRRTVTQYKSDQGGVKSVCVVCQPTAPGQGSVSARRSFKHGLFQPREPSYAVNPDVPLYRNTRGRMVGEAPGSHQGSWAQIRGRGPRWLE